MVSANSKFDQWLRGETSLTPSEMNGYVIFNTETGDCFHCHGTILFTTNLFYNNAKDSIFNDSTSLKDRYSITHDPQDIGAFRAPSLRNIELTGPYMHDGRFATLTDVINFYSEGLIWSPYVHPFMKKVNDGGIQLTPTQKADLLAFLKTLTDQTFINNPDYTSPF
jgi:cytochrome c peroxidase